jgi:hypothetical protein
MMTIAGTGVMNIFHAPTRGHVILDFIGGAGSGAIEPASCAEIFTTGARVHGLGERIVQPDLAETLRRIAEERPDVFCTGAIGRRIAADLRRNAGTVTAEDLAACAVEPWRRARSSPPTRCAGPTAALPSRPMRSRTSECF